MLLPVGPRLGYCQNRMHTMFDPKNWPTGCPPQHAVKPPVEGLTVYRIVKSNPPTRDDFLSYQQQGKAVAGGAAQQCKARAISVYTDADEAEALARGSGGKFGDFIAEGVLGLEAGLIKPALRGSHISWWPCDDVTRETGFTVVRSI